MRSHFGSVFGFCAQSYSYGTRICIHLVLCLGFEHRATALADVAILVLCLGVEHRATVFACVAILVLCLVF